MLPASPTEHENQPSLWRQHLPRPQKHQHKYSRGSALVYGGLTMTGAARLSALACARSGAGATTIACDASVWPVYAQTQLSIMVKAWAHTSRAGCMAQEGNYQAVLVGPGLTPDVITRDLVDALLTHPTANQQSWVLDAGALVAFMEQPQHLFERIQAASLAVVLTPHEGEFERLFPDLAQHKTPLTKPERARRASQRSGAVLILKGSDTVIAQPQGATVLQTRSSPYLATAGSGDVLAGMITGLLAQGVAPFAAACIAVWAHSQAGLLGGAGLIADDLVQWLPQIWQALLKE